jgi:hypothetical protein
MAVAGAVLLLAAPAAVAGGPVPGQPDVTITLTPDRPSTGQTVTAVVRATVDDGQVACVDIAWGDTAGQGVCMYASYLEPPTGPHEVEYSFTHAYRHPGPYVVRASATKDVADDPADTGHGATPLVVQPGPAKSNGPAEPRFFPGQFRPPGADRRTTHVTGSAGDDDGYVTEVVLAWGDGTTERRTYDLADCTDPVVTWPSSRHEDERFNHRYRRTGDRTVTVTTTSSGCDGSDRQVRTERLKVQVPSRF